jgi:hypothetical protein
VRDPNQPTQAVAAGFTPHNGNMGTFSDFNSAYKRWEARRGTNRCFVIGPMNKGRVLVPNRNDFAGSGGLIEETSSLNSNDTTRFGVAAKTNKNRGPKPIRRGRSTT